MLWGWLGLGLLTSRSFLGSWEKGWETYGPQEYWVLSFSRLNWVCLYFVEKKP